MNKVIKTASWLTVIFLAYTFAVGFVGLPENNDQYPLLAITFQNDKPAVYRVIVPALARVLYELGMPADHSVALIVFLSALATILLIHINPAIICK